MTGRENHRAGEFDIIAGYFAPLAARDGAFGLLDDAARLRVDPDEDLVLTKDTLAAGVHFFPHDPAGLVARKALRVNLSDLAAKGARPRAYLLSLALPGDWTEQWLSDFTSGLAEDQARFQVELYGGDTLKSPDGLVISITAIGSVPRDSMVTRLGGKPGDLLYVSGTIGDAALGLSVHGAEAETADWPLTQAEREQLRRRYLLPQPRMELAGAVRGHASASMDISDGLLGDLAKLCKASQVGARIRVDAIPHSPAAKAMMRHAERFRAVVLNGGDDYELLCAVPEGRTLAFERDALAAGTAVFRIGELTNLAHGVSVVDSAGEIVPLSGRSFEHF